MHGLPAPLLPKSRILFAGSKLCGFRSFKVEKVGSKLKKPLVWLSGTSAVRS